MKINIYKMNEEDWYAAESLDDAIEERRRDVGEDQLSAELAEFKPRQLTDEELVSLEYVDIEADPIERRSFRDQLQREIEQGVKFPRLFATTEY